jgi:Protein of unknown function (DUF4239)
VITSVSLLFASLIGLTISHHHARQVDIHKTLILEVHKLRGLLSLLNSAAAAAAFPPERLLVAQDLVQQHTNTLFSAKFSSSTEREHAHSYIESCLPALLDWCIADELFWTQQHHHSNDRRIKFHRDRSSSAAFPLTSERILLLVYELTQGLLDERGKRWMALQTVPFPAVHYLTLGVLAFSIMIAFLVATAQAEFIFLHGLPVRVLWSVLITSFTALGVVCYDLASPFGGAYHVN